LPLSPKNPERTHKGRNVGQAGSWQCVLSLNQTLVEAQKQTVKRSAGKRLTFYYETGERQRIALPAKTAKEDLQRGRYSRPRRWRNRAKRGHMERLAARKG